MEKKVNGKSVVFAVIAICSVALTSWEDAINMPCMASIYEEFTNSSAFLKSYVITGPNLVALPFIMLTGRLAGKISKKTIILTANIFYTIGGLGGAFAYDMAGFALCRTIVGVAIGVEATAIMGVLFELFPKLEDSARVMGIYQGINTVYGSAAATLAGIVCMKGWRYAQLLNALSVLSLLALLFFLPKTPPEAGMEQPEKSVSFEGCRDRVDYRKFIFTLMEACVFIMFSFLFYYFSSLYLAERGIGGSVLSGFLSSAMLLGAAGMNFLLGALYKRTKRYTGVVCVSALSVGFLLIGLDVPAWTLLIFAVMNGAVCGVIGSYYPIAVNACVPAGRATFFQSVYSCVIFAAYCLCSYVPVIYRFLFRVGYHRMMTVNAIALGVAAISVYIGIRRFAVNEHNIKI